MASSHFLPTDIGFIGRNLWLDGMGASLFKSRDQTYRLTDKSSYRQGLKVLGDKKNQAKILGTLHANEILGAGGALTAASGFASLACVSALVFKWSLGLMCAHLHPPSSDHTHAHHVLPSA